MFVYVILHYNTLDITIDCIAHLEKLFPESRIVIVDNGSPDGSGQYLQRLYGQKDNIDLILSPENLGFAKGNNLGYQLAISKYHPEYIVVMNNDVIITQPDFEKNISAYMNKHKIDVCGPDILTPDGNQQNPLLEKPFSTFRILKQIAIDSVRLWCLRLNIFTNHILKKYQNVTKTYHTEPKKIDNIRNCVLHGSCIIYGSNYLANSSYAFVPVTFLYGEEMILHDHIMKLGLSTGICPTAQVTHLGGKSTNQSGNMRQRQIFKMKCVISSMWKVVKGRW